MKRIVILITFICIFFIVFGRSQAQEVTTGVASANHEKHYGKHYGNSPIVRCVGWYQVRGLIATEELRIGIQFI